MAHAHHKCGVAGSGVNAFNAQRPHSGTRAALVFSSNRRRVRVGHAQLESLDFLLAIQTK